MKYRKIRK